MSFVQFTPPPTTLCLNNISPKNRIHIYKNILLLQLYMYLYASVTAGTVCPAAIYVVRTIYIPTNNVVPIQYLHHSSHLFAAIHLFTRSVTKSKISTSPAKKLVAATAVFATSYILIALSRKGPQIIKKQSVFPRPVLFRISQTIIFL